MTNPDIDSVLWAEALGDASNFKGTDYHLLYAVWLLLCRKVPSVAFLAGNDLLVSLSAPISPDSEESESAQLFAAPTVDSDEWVQLKSTALAWTVSKILDGNLLSNFVCNSFRSDTEERGPIRTGAVFFLVPGAFCHERNPAPPTVFHSFANDVHE